MPYPLTHLIADVPSAPLNLYTTEVKCDSLTLNWSKPRSDGGAKIKHYIVERRDTTSAYWSNVALVDASRSTCYKVMGLQAGAEYYFR